MTGGEDTGIQAPPGPVGDRGQARPAPARVALVGLMVVLAIALRAVAPASWEAPIKVIVVGYALAFGPSWIRLWVATVAAALAGTVGLALVLMWWSIS